LRQCDKLLIIAYHLITVKIINSWVDHTTQLCGLHANCRQRVSTAWAGDTDKKNYDQKPLPVSPKQKYMAASKDLVLRVFGERVFRNGYRLKQNTFIQSSTKQVCFNLVGYLYMGPGLHSG